MHQSVLDQRLSLQVALPLLEDVLKVQMLVALATEVAATQTKPAAAGS
jgi:hypothetical protein